MIPVRTTVVVKDGGVSVDVLLTPHLYSFKDQFGIDFATNLENAREVMENYADVCFLGAVNAWILDGKGTTEDLPFTRGDFHAWAAQAPKEFGNFVSFAVCALTGKTQAELAEDVRKKSTAAAKEDADEPGERKKKRWPWTGRKSKRSS